MRACCVCVCARVRARVRVCVGKIHAGCLDVFGLETQQRSIHVRPTLWFLGFQCSFEANGVGMLCSLGFCSGPARKKMLPRQVSAQVR